MGKGTHEDVSLLILHLGIQHTYDEIYEEAKKIVPNADIIGCSGAGVIGKEGPEESTFAIALMAIKGKEVHVSHVDEIDGRNLREKARNLAASVKGKSQDINMLYYIGNGIDVSNDKVIEGIEEIFGQDITIFGCTSADTMKAKVNYQFMNMNTLQKGAILVGFSDPSLEVFTGATHGFVPKEDTRMEVTKSDANQIIEIDNKPATSVLTDKLKVLENADLGMIIPIGALAEELPDEMQEQYHNRMILRVITRKDDDGSFYSTTEVPQGKVLYLTDRDEDAIFQGTDRLAKEIAEKASNRKPVAVFHADCGARGKLRGAKVLKEEIANRMQEPVNQGDSSVPWLGIYGFGEFAKIGNKNVYHNYTTSLYAIYRK